MVHLICDIGGTWIKGATFTPDERTALTADPAELTRRMHRVPTPRDAGGFRQALLSLAAEAAAGRPVASAVVSTAGILHPSGLRLITCANHLAFLRTPDWAADLEAALGGPVRLINDAEAFLLGAAETGRVPRLGTLCVLVVGTGLGCAVSRDARHWRPQGRPSLLGSIRCGGGQTYDSLASASRLAAHDPGGNLVSVLTDPAHSATRDTYFSNLSEILLSAAILHHAEHLLLGGGLADAAREAGFDLTRAIRAHWHEPPPELGFWPDLQIATEGNALALLGAGAYAAALHPPPPRAAAFASLTTEQADPTARDLHRQDPRAILEKLWASETAAGNALEHSLDALASLASHIISQWDDGGRILYVGAGTSGRLAALDAVEIPCTFGCSPDRVVAVIAGGLIDSALRIESEGEEDFHAAPDLILLQPGPRDTVIGISASGSAAFVRSALSYARQRGAKTALVKASEPFDQEPWDWTIPLASGPEVVAGSTRMKAGTATKKVLNFLTTTVMARTGKLRGPHMVDMACLNAKLVDRARRILTELFPLSPQEADALLVRHNFQLRSAIESLENS